MAENLIVVCVAKLSRLSMARYNLALPPPCQLTACGFKEINLLLERFATEPVENDHALILELGTNGGGTFHLRKESDGSVWPSVLGSKS